MKLGTETGSLVNHIYSNMTNTPNPKAGMGATELCWTDRHPYTIVEVSKSGKTLWATRDSVKVIRGSIQDGSAEYEFTSNLDAPRTKYTFRKNGLFVRHGDSITGSTLLVGKREEYHDPHF